MSKDLGWWAPGSTLVHMFATYDSNDPTASVTMSGLAVTGIEVYAGTSMTQRASDAGYTLIDTDGIDIDSTTGVHGFSIDLSDNTTAGFYKAGEIYHVIVNGMTVDAGSVSYVAGFFRIGMPNAILNTTIATLASQTSFTLTAGSANDDAYNGCEVVVYDVATQHQKAIGIVSDYTGSTKTITLKADPGIFTMAVTDNICILPNNALEIAKEVWDRVLSGATHNIASSAGRRLRTLQTGGGYSGGAIYIDTVNGTAGTTDFENGVDSNPVDSIADANTLASSLGISTFVIAPGSTITLAAAQNNQVFTGRGWTLALGGQDVAGSTFIGATVSGIMAGTGTTQYFIDCLMNATSVIAGTHMIACAIANTQTVVEAGDIFYDRCHSGVAGTGTWSFDFGAAIGNSNLNMRNYSGGVQLENMGDTGTDTASIEGQGQVIEGTCTGGTVAIRGAFTVSSITNLTLSDDARIDVAQINSEALDVLNTDTFAEPSSVPAATASLVDKIGWLAALARNKITQTSTTQTLRNDADGADIGTAAVSDDGTTFTRAEWS